MKYPPLIRLPRVILPYFEIRIQVSGFRIQVLVTRPEIALQFLIGFRIKI